MIIKVSALNQLLQALRFFASSCHFRSGANFMGIGILTASRIVARVTSALASQEIVLWYTHSSAITR